MISKSYKLIAVIAMLSIVGGSFIGCTGNEGSGNAPILSISGSTSVGPLMEKIATQYENVYSDMSIEINQVGSSAGIKDTISGVSDLGMASRDLKDKEKEDVTGTVIAYDGIALIVNKDNPIKGISLEELKGIYTGKITNWNELEGGLDMPIVVVSREEGSGTRTAFEELVKYKSEELIQEATIADGSGSIKTTVKGNKNAIGFVSFEYLDDQIGDLEIDGVKPEAELVKSGEYKLSRPFILANKNNGQTENSKKIIEYILSEEGQKIVAENKLITVK